MARRGLVAAWLALAVTARADLRRCERTIVAASAARLRVLVHRGSADTTRSATRIGRACCGPDRRCGTLDDDPLAALGWRARCPGFVGASCDAPLASAPDVAACLACIGDAALGILRSVPGHCARRAVARFVSVKSRALARCWRARLGGRQEAPCPDGHAAAAIGAARTRLVARLTAACTGPPPASGCPAPCTGPLDLAACIGCLADRAVDCADRAAVPGLVLYPSECRPAAGACSPGVMCSSALDCPAGYDCRDNGVPGTRYCVGPQCTGDADCDGGAVCRQSCSRTGFAVMCGARRCQCPGFGCPGGDQLCFDDGGLACHRLCLNDSDCTAPFGFVCVNQGTFGFGTCVGATACE